MSLKGTVKNGSVKLPRGSKLPDGTMVEIVPIPPSSENPPFLKEILKLAKDRDWPKDFALNHGHKLTARTLRESRAGKNVKHFKTCEELYRDLGL